MVAMESTASYWKPLFNIFESSDLKSHSSECPPYESSSRPKDRCERRRMDCGSSSARIALAQLYSG